MGSYLEIDKRETNSKGASRLLIHIIRDLNEVLPDLIVFNENQNSYTIKKEGIAALLKLILLIEGDDKKGYLKEYIETYIEPCKNRDVRINNELKDINFSVSFCIRYLRDILIDMTLDHKKSVKTRWV